jgi:hypothetical protein
VTRFLRGPRRPIEVFGGANAQLDRCHRLQLVELDRPPGAGIVEPGAGPIERFFDATQEIDYVGAFDGRIDGPR